MAAGRELHSRCSDVAVDAAVREPEWDAFVRAHPDATGHHCWGWRRVIEEAFGHPTEYLAARRGGALVGVLPLVCFRSLVFGRAVISLPFLNYGGVVADDKPAADALLAAAQRLADRERARYVELRHRRRQFPALAVRQHKVAMLKRLGATADETWNGLDRKVRNQVRKAQKSGLEVVWGAGELVPDFYGVFARNMRDLGTPVYTRRLFASAAAQFAEHFRILLVRRGPRTVAGGCAFMFRDAVEVHWAGSLASERSRCPNHLLYWSVIEWAIERRLACLDFGRCTPGEGTYQFKLQWGATPEPLSWEYVLLGATDLPDHGPTNPRFHAAVCAWKRMPLLLANLVGPAIVRGIP